MPPLFSATYTPEPNTDLWSDALIFVSSECFSVRDSQRLHKEGCRRKTFRA